MVKSDPIDVIDLGDQRPKFISELPFFIEVYCINIRKRPDRLEMFKEAAEDGRIYRINPSIEITTHWENNLDGEDITNKWLEEKEFGLFDWEMTKEDAQAIDVDWGKWWSRPLTQGEIGCTISHTEIWKRAMNYTLVLEDDVTFTVNWISKLKLAMKNLDIIDKDWDLLYLGRVPQEDNETKVHNNIVKPKFSFCTYAYMLSPKGIKKIRQYNVEKSIIPADEFLSATYVNHPREDVRLKYPPTLNAYAIEPQIVLQRSKSVAGSDTGLP